MSPTPWVRAALKFIRTHRYERHLHMLPVRKLPVHELFEGLQCLVIDALGSPVNVKES